MNQKRKQVNLELKLEVVKRLKSGKKSVGIGRNLSLAPTTIRTIYNRDIDQTRVFAKPATPLQSKQITKITSLVMNKMQSLFSM